MKNILLYTLAITLLGLIGYSDHLAEAASVPDNWSQKLKCENSCPRFQVLKSWDNAAVLDKETSLVWQQSPENVNAFTWSQAQSHCNKLQVSNRMGWRLPTLQEFGSLIDLSEASPALPSGHPFSNVENANYWTATTNGGIVAAWVVNTNAGNTFGATQTNSLLAWCVRGGSGADDQ